MTALASSHLPYINPLPVALISTLRLVLSSIRRARTADTCRIFSNRSMMVLKAGDMERVPPLRA